MAVLAMGDWNMVPAGLLANVEATDRKLTALVPPVSAHSCLLGAGP